jgi:16S rRNA U1498 N3-methylase RsmE
VDHFCGGVVYITLCRNSDALRSQQNNSVIATVVLEMSLRQPRENDALIRAATGMGVSERIPRLTERLPSSSLS